MASKEKLKTQTEKDSIEMKQRWKMLKKYPLVKFARRLNWMDMPRGYLFSIEKSDKKGEMAK